MNLNQQEEFMLNFKIKIPIIKKHKKAFRVISIYVIFAVIAAIFCWLFPSDTKNANVAFFVGIAGTLASLYSIYVSAQDEERSKKEREENNQFLDELSKNLGFVLGDTKYLKEGFKEFLNAYLQSNVDDGTEKTEDASVEKWKKPNDEQQPS